MLIATVFWSIVSAMLQATVGGVHRYAKEAPYLFALSQEAQKVEAETLPTLSETGEPVPAPGGGFSLQAFEEDLKMRYKGVYAPCIELPKRSREAFFLAYRNGALIDGTHKKNMDRFLHQ
jgi:hypothetical protein